MMDNSYSNTGYHPPGSEADRPGAKTEQTQQEAQHLTEKIKEQGQSLLAERKKATADEIRGVAEALRKAAHEMHQQEHPPMVTPYAEWAGDTLEQFSSTLRERDLNTLVRQTEDFARRQPGIFLGGAVVTGFLLARFLKSSALHSEYDYAHSTQASHGQGAGHHHLAARDQDTTTATPLAGARPSTPTAGTTTSTQHRGEP
jgi:hypothetical protein